MTIHIPGDAEYKQALHENRALVSKHVAGVRLQDLFDAQAKERAQDLARIPPESPKPSQVLNFLWLNLDFPARPDPEDGSINKPMPEDYIGNIRKAGENQPQADIVLWVDSMRLTKKQLDYLKLSVERGLKNVSVKDLRGIPAYDREDLYNHGETDRYWRSGGENSMIWRQVDAAKVLVSLQGDYDQTFFADIDHYHLDIGGKKVQGMLDGPGIMIGSSSDEGLFIENQLWGFTPGRRGFFEEYYKDTLEEAYKGKNGWGALKKKVVHDLESLEKLSRLSFILPIVEKGQRARHPGHEWKDGEDYWKLNDPERISAAQLSSLFGAPAPAQAAPAAPAAVAEFLKAVAVKARKQAGKKAKTGKKGPAGFAAAALPPKPAPFDLSALALPPVAKNKFSVIPSLLAKAVLP